MSDLTIDLSDLDIEDVELLALGGSRGMPEFAASSCTGGCICNAGGCSCTQEQQQQTVQ